MAALTAATTTIHSAGDQTKYVFTIAAIAIGGADTFDTGLGEKVQDFTYIVTADPSTDTSAGGNITESAGVFTFFPGVAALSGTLTVYASGV